MLSSASSEKSGGGADAFGFEQRIYQKNDVFGDLQNCDQFAAQFMREGIKQLLVSPLQTIVVTNNNKFFRMRENIDNTFIQLEIPERIDQPQGAVQSVLSGVIGIGQKILFLDRTTTITIDRVFLDPTGNHCLIASDTGVCFYLHLQHEESLRPLNNVRGSEFIITSVGWDEITSGSRAPDEFKRTKNILLGTSKGVIYIYRLELQQKDVIESTPTRELELNDGRAILSIRYLKIQRSERGSQEERNFFVLASTTQSIYCFHGSDISMQLSKYRQYEAQKQVEMNYSYLSSTSSALSVCNLYNNGIATPNSFIWTNGQSLLFNNIPRYYEGFKIDSIKDMKRLKFAKMYDESASASSCVRSIEMPIDLILLEFHYLLLHADSLTVLSRINEKVVARYDLSFMAGGALGISYDPFHKVLWIYSSRNLQRLSIQDEEKDGWILYLEKQEYRQAYESAKKSNNLDDVLGYLAGLYADELFVAKKFEKAGQLYFETYRSFEEIVLKFVNASIAGVVEARDGLEEYLSLWLKNLKSEAKVQKSLLLNWLLEIKVQKVNYIENKRQLRIVEMPSQFKSDEQQKAYQDYIDQYKRAFELKRLNMQQFLLDNINFFDENTVYQIAQSHGRLQDCLEFARKKGNYAVIIQQNLNEDNYAQVLKEIHQITKDRTRNELLIANCHRLIHQETSLTIEAFRSYKLKTDKTQRLVRCLLDVPSDSRHDAITYLNEIIAHGNKEKVIHNLLVLFLSQLPTDYELCNYLEKQEKVKREKERVYFSFEFALSLVKANHMSAAEIQLYGLMDMYSEAVTKALNQDERFYALNSAEKPVSTTEQKKLLLQIALHYINKGEGYIQDVVELTEQYPLLKIEDLLPYFTEQTCAKDIISSVCSGLKIKSSEIEALRGQIKVYSTGADKIKLDMRRVNKCHEVNAEKVCLDCSRSLFAESFYIFPCKHGFHKECLIRKIGEQGIDHLKLDKIKQLNQKIEQISLKQEAVNNYRQRKSSDDGLFFNPLNKIISLAARVSDDLDDKPVMTPAELKELHSQRIKLDEELATECIECGPGIVDSIYSPFDFDVYVSNSWKI